jgi:hypothetical protein
VLRLSGSGLSGSGLSGSGLSGSGLSGSGLGGRARAAGTLDAGPRPCRFFPSIPVWSGAW